ncbi:MAG: leucine-rich repeat protein [Clostridia bacterium]
MKKVLGLVLAIMLCLSYVPCFAQEDGTYENFIIEETDDTVIVKGCNDTSITKLYIPGEINGKKVVLQKEAFGNYKFQNLVEVTIGEGIEVLPYGLFPIGNKIKTVNLPESLEEIGGSCFYGGWELEEIDLKNVKKIGEDTFHSCYKLKKVTHNGKLEYIDVLAFAGCTNLSEIDLRSVKHLGREAFGGCGLTEVVLESIESWDGIKDEQVNSDGKYYRKQIPLRHGGMDLYYGIKAYYLGTPFTGCNSLEKVTVRFPSNTTGEPFPSLLLNCNNVKSFTIENYQDCLASWEFATLSFDNSNGDIYINKMPHTVTIYSSEDKAEEYAKKLGLEFVLTENNSIEVEPTIQGIHGGIVLRFRFVERITKIAESMGGTVNISDGNIAVQKDDRSLVIMGDTVYYMDNGVMVTESLYEDQSYIKIPEKALESVLGKDLRKSEKYKSVINSFNSNLYRIAGTIETPYGSVVEIYTGGVMHSFANVLKFVKWDGTTVNITNDAPSHNTWSKARWEKIELSEDGKIITITYPENKEKEIFSQSPDFPGRVLWDEGTYIITANLETGEVNCVIKPLKKEVEEDKEEDKKPVEEWVEPAKTIEQDGMNVSVSILSEPQNGPSNMFDENYISYCVLYVKDEERPEYMEFDLGEVKQVQQIALAFRDATTRTTYFDIRVSEDGVNYETVIPKRGSNPDTNELQYFDINKSARYVRMYGYSNTYNKKWVSITEARVLVK